MDGCDRKVTEQGTDDNARLLLHNLPLNELLREGASCPVAESRQIPAPLLLCNITHPSRDSAKKLPQHNYTEMERNNKAEDLIFSFFSAGGLRGLCYAHTRTLYTFICTLGFGGTMHTSECRPPSQRGLHRHTICVS